jgi:proline dehydrogenase
MLDNASKTFFHLLAKSTVLQKLSARYGMRKPTSFARRFVAGETVADAIAAARSVEAIGLLQTLDYLGENVATLAEADAATAEYRRIIVAVTESGIGRNLSLKLTQLGLDVAPASAVGYTDMGVVLQADLYRTERDVERIIALGARVRLVKGAYKEPKSVAYQSKKDVDAAYARLLKVLLSRGTHPAIATHDPAIVDLARRYADEQGIGRDRFEFQMLYGIRRDLQNGLVGDGYAVRVYIPFGRQWFPYFMRRLGERPANVGFVIRGIVGEKG